MNPLSCLHAVAMLSHALLDSLPTHIVMITVAPSRKWKIICP